jgi:opacity protein-like surface antigen
MRKTLFFAVLVLAVSLNCAASDVPKAEIFGGYSFLHAPSGVTNVSGYNANGWDAALTVNLNKYLGITADMNGEYKTIDQVKAHLHNFLFGPEIAFRAPKAKPFAHVLFGVGHASGSTSFAGVTTSISDNALTTAFGGGLDVSVAPMVSVRLGQFDYVRTTFGSTSQNNLRYAAGIVLKF